MFIYLFFWERESVCEQVRGREREGNTESEAGSRLWAVSTEPNAGFRFKNCKIMTWDKVGRLTDRATQAPHIKPVSNQGYFILHPCLIFLLTLISVVRVCLMSSIIFSSPISILMIVALNSPSGKLPISVSLRISGHGLILFFHLG